jgi:hypothetical protein
MKPALIPQTCDRPAELFLATGACFLADVYPSAIAYSDDAPEDYDWDYDLDAEYEAYLAGLVQPLLEQYEPESA